MVRHASQEAPIHVCMQELGPLRQLNCRLVRLHASHRMPRSILAVSAPLVSLSAAASFIASRDAAEIADFRTAHPRLVTLSMHAHALVRRNSVALRFIIALSFV
eukprot:1062444-Pleurochrysis_carterae.AAC.1